MSDIEQMSYKDLIFMQKNLKIISHIRILTARAFKCSVAREEEEGRGWQGRLDCRTGNVGSFAPVQIENQPSVNTPVTRSIKSGQCVILLKIKMSAHT